MTIRKKIFLILVLMPVVALLIFSYFATAFFIKERLSFMRDFQISLANQKLVQLNKEYDSKTGLENSDKESFKFITFDPADLYEIIIINDGGQIQASNRPGLAGKSILDIFSLQDLKGFKDPANSNRSFLVEDLQGHKKHLSIAANKRYAVIVSFLDSVLWRAALPFLLKAMGTFIVLIFSIVGLGYYLSQSLITDLKKLGQIMGLFRSGNLQVRVKSSKKDEVSQVAMMFDGMADDLVDMMEAQQEKAALEKELQLAEEVQKRMLPIKGNFPEIIQYSSALHMATSCGGDWLFYHINQKQFIFLVGDVTGHGVAAALITSAARSVFSTFEVDEPPSPAEMMHVLNRAIFSTGQGSIQMTMFIGSLDLKSLDLTYANASHEFPFLIRPADEKVSLKNFDSLNGRTGSRLGESAESSYQNTQIQMNKGDYLFCLSDGIYELQDENGNFISEGLLIRMISRLLSGVKNPDTFMSEFEASLRSTNNFKKLRDDISLVLWRIV